MAPAPAPTYPAPCSGHCGATVPVRLGSTAGRIFCERCRAARVCTWCGAVRNPRRLINGVCRTPWGAELSCVAQRERVAALLEENPSNHLVVGDDGRLIFIP